MDVEGDELIRVWLGEGGDILSFIRSMPTCSDYVSVVTIVAMAIVHSCSLR